MIDWDWTFMGQVNAWQSIATIAVIIIAVFIIARMAIRFWPWLKKVIALFDALAQLPAFIDRTDEAIKDIHHETHRNDGSSLKDAQVRTEEAVERIELGVKGLYDRVDASDRADAALRKDLEDTKPHRPQSPPRPRRPQKPKE